jgi:hypothetical protein
LWTSPWRTRWRRSAGTPQVYGARLWAGWEPRGDQRGAMIARHAAEHDDPGRGD